MTMMLNVISPHIYPLMEYLYYAQARATTIAFSQRELNEVYLGPVFSLSFRCAQLLMTVFVSMLYGAGIPILYPIATIMFLINFYVDKFLLFYHYRIPPSYSERIAEWMGQTMIYASIFHLGFATWMYSAKGIFWNGSSLETSSIAVYLGLNVNTNNGGFDFEERMALNNIIPLYITLLLVALLKLFSYCFTGIDKIRALCCQTVTCGIFDDGTIKRRYLNPDLTDALEQGELRGLTNYNILQNPTYARALGVDAKFAQAHRHVASVHEASAVNLPTLPKSFTVTPLETINERQRADSQASTERPTSIRSLDTGSHVGSVRMDVPTGSPRSSVANAFFRGDLPEERPRGDSLGSRRSLERERAESIGSTRNSINSRPISVTNVERSRQSLARVFDVNLDDF